MILVDYPGTGSSSGAFGPNIADASRRMIAFLDALTKTTTLTPDQYIAGLTDFGPGRSKVFSNSADDYLKVYDVGATEATEGSGGVWERLHYDWSDPDRVVLTTTDSNVWNGASGYTYTFTRSTDGTTDVNVVIVRQGKNAKGRILSLVLGGPRTRTPATKRRP